MAGVYVYECESHGQFEIVKPMADSSKEEMCPVCGASARRRYTSNAIYPNGSSGNGYFLDSKTGLTSKRPKSKRWV